MKKRSKMSANKSMNMSGILLEQIASPTGSSNMDMFEFSSTTQTSINYHMLHLHNLGECNKAISNIREQCRTAIKQCKTLKIK